MEKEIILEQLLNSTIERMNRQHLNYEIEIANLQGQVIALKNENDKLNNDIQEFDADPEE